MAAVPVTPKPLRRVDHPQASHHVDAIARLRRAQCQMFRREFIFFMPFST
jgi:hypothetical protein